MVEHYIYTMLVLFLYKTLGFRGLDWKFNGIKIEHLIVLGIGNRNCNAVSTQIVAASHLVPREATAFS